MRVYSALVVYNEHGASVLGVRQTTADAMAQCELFHKEHHPDLDQTFHWLSFKDITGEGMQAPFESSGQCYYVEETEIDTDVQFSTDHLHLIQQNGRLAEQVETARAMYKPLEERELQLSVFIDHLLDKLGLEEYDFPEMKALNGTQINGELWHKGEPA